MSTATKKRLQELQKLITHHQTKYHTDDAPEISDEAYDSLVRELTELEEEFPDLVDERVSQQVGGVANAAFSKITHQVRQWSFDNVFSDDELRAWEERLYRHLEKAGVTDRVSYVAEHKIDGLKLILEYTKGVLVRASTRGNGQVGEDVTHTASTIKDVPQKLTQAVDLIAVGEVWLGADEFERINVERKKNGEATFMNPRNAAAGSLRQLDAKVTATRNLSLYTYDIDYFAAGGTAILKPKTQSGELELLKKLGFTVNPHNTHCADVDAIIKYYNTWTKKRDSLQYGVDGVVIKVDEVSAQTVLGHTAKAPRFGIAYKFPSEEATTVIEGITLQVGRTGKVTPVAELRPVLIAGSTVARATLHNEDFIHDLDVRIGDTVVLHKSGDIIPEILQVLKELRPASAKVWKFPKVVAGCGGDGAIERVPGEAAHRCVSMDSGELARQRLYYFVSKGAFNIDGVGPRNIDQFLDAGLIEDAADLWKLKVSQLEDLEGFKKKSAENTVAAIGTAASQPLHRFLIALSIDHVGEETARLLASERGSVASIQTATVAELAAIHGVGDVMAESVVAWFKNSENKKFLKKLLKHVTVEERGGKAAGSGKSAAFATTGPTPLTGKTLVFTGTLPTLSRDDAKEMARNAGAKISSSISKNTDYLVAGADPGSKTKKAADLDVEIINETDFLQLVK